MDSRSHVEFAKRLLPSHLQSAAVGALFPQIDRQPATLHRNFAHHVSKTGELVEDGLRIVLRSGDADTSKYTEKRFAEEKHRILEYFSGNSLRPDLNDDVRDATRMAFVSHLYLDTFNQPVQAFTPFKSNCAGQFELWDRIGDFRYPLYVAGRVEALRKDWLKSSIWTKQFHSNEIMQAMIMRLADLAGLARNAQPVLDALTSVSLPKQVMNEQAITWCQDMEFELCDLHIRHLG